MSERGAEDRMAAEKRLDERFSGSDRFHDRQLKLVDAGIRDLLKAEIARVEVLVAANEAIARERSDANRRAVDVAIEASRTQWRVILSVFSILVAIATVIVTFVTLISSAKHVGTG